MLRRRLCRLMSLVLRSWGFAIQTHDEESQDEYKDSYLEYPVRFMLGKFLATGSSGAVACGEDDGECCPRSFSSMRRGVGMSYGFVRCITTLKYAITVQQV